MKHATDDELLDQLRSAWPMMTWRDTGDIPRTVVVMHSVAVYLPPSWQPLLPAYEERFLCYLLGLAARGTRVVYVTSMPILPRLVDYWLSLVPGLDGPDVRSRLTLVSIVDARPIALTRKVLDHPGVIARIRDAVVDPAWAVTMGHTVTDDDVELARRLGVPTYGPSPRTAARGTKSGSRQTFAEAGVALVPGVDGVRTRDDVAAATERLCEQLPGLAKVVVKLDAGVSGIGNGTIRIDSGVHVRDLPDRIELEEGSIPVDDYYDQLASQGGVVEAFIEGVEVRSPSVQLRISPVGQPEVLSTHEQLLGGPSGLTYEGCAMPACADYSGDIARDALAVANRLAGEGVVGRFSIDFLAVRRDAGWSTYALEINLRNGGTTHPLTTLTALCGGGYDVESGQFRTDSGAVKCYRATDHLADPSYAHLTTDDVLDLLEERGLGWDPATQTGAVFHMASAIAAMGVIGVTVIADDPQAAEREFERVRSALDEAGGRAGRPPTLSAG